MLGSPRRPATPCNTACGRPIRHFQGARLLMNRLRLAVLAALALVATACGGGGSDDKASSGTDVDELLKQTFTGAKSMKSGKLDLSLKLDAKGGASSQLNGPV